MLSKSAGCSFAQAALQAADFDNIADLALQGHYIVVSQQCQDSVNAINARRAMGQGTAKADYILLDDPSYGGKFNGVTHMMMDGTDNLQVMDVMLDWAGKYIDNPPST